MGGTLTPEVTPGGGLTMVLDLGLPDIDGVEVGRGHRHRVDPAHPRQLLTEPGMGYRFLAQP